MLDRSQLLRDGKREGNSSSPGKGKPAPRATPASPPVTPPRGAPTEELDHAELPTIDASRQTRPTPVRPPSSPGRSQGAPAAAGPTTPEGPRQRPASRPAQQLQEDEAEDTPPPMRREHLTPEHPGRYKMKREFGRGGQSSVWLAFDTHVGREVAFKQLLPQNSDRRAGASQQVISAMQARFVSEARITGQLEHPNIVPVYEVGRRADGSLYYTQKLVRGRTFSAALKDAPELRQRLGLLSHFVALCHAMAYAHGRGFIHRDLKPDNVMVGEFGETVVLDWGLAKRMHEEEVELSVEEEAGRTQEGDVMGTPAYMSPEQATGSTSQVDHQSDVWSLGAVLFEMLTGRPPFTGRNLMQMLMQVAKDPIPTVRSLNPKVPPELAAIAERALTRDKSVRYQSATQIVQDIEAWRTGGRVSVFRYTPWQTTLRWLRKNRYVALTAGLVLLAILGGAARVWAENRVARRNLAQAYLEKSAAASRELMWAQAAAYAAKARAEDDTAEARWRAVHRGPLEIEPIGRLSLDGPAEQVALSPDGKHVAVALVGHGIHLLDTATGRETGTIDIEGLLTSLAFSADGSQLVGAVGNAVHVWTATGEPLAHFEASGRVSQAQLSPDGARLALAEGNAVGLFETTGWKRLARLEGHTKPVLSVAFSADGEVLASGGEDGTLRAFTQLPAQPGGRAQMRLVRGEGHGALTRLGFAPGGHVIVAAGVDSTVRFFDADSADLRQRINRSSPFVSMAASAEGIFLALAQDNTALFIDSASMSAVARLEGDDAATCVALSADGRVAASANRDGKLRLWKIGTGARVVGHSVPPPFTEAKTVALSPDARRAALGDSEGHVVVLDVATGNVQRSFDVPKPPVVSLSWDQGQGQHLAVADGSETVSLFEIDSGNRVALEGHGGAVQSVAFSPDGKLLASTGSDGAIRFWDLSGAPKAVINASNQPINALAWSADSKLLASGGDDRTIRIYEAASRTLKRKVEGAPDGILALAFSPHASLVASAGRDQGVRTWRVNSGESRSEWVGHGGRVWSISFAPDGETLATASIDGTIRLWDVRTGRQVIRFDRAPSVSALVYSKDGRLLASAGQRPALQTIEIDDKATLKKPDAELDLQLQRHRLRLDGISLVDDQEALAVKATKKK